MKSRELVILREISELFRKNEILSELPITICSGVSYDEFMHDIQLETQAVQIIGDKNSMEFLTKYDPSLLQSIAIFNANDGVKELMCSERLANHLLVKLQLDEIRRLRHVIKDIFENYKQ